MTSHVELQFKGSEIEIIIEALRFQLEAIGISDDHAVNDRMVEVAELLEELEDL